MEIDPERPERRARRRDGSARPAATGRVVKDAGTLLAGDVVDRGIGLVFLILATKLFGLEI